MPIDFYYLEFSPPCRSVLLLAKAIGVHLNLKTISPMKGEHMKSEFVKLNPQHVIPTIDDNGFVLCESRPIMGYLVSKYAKNDSLYPKDPKRRGIVDQMLYFDIGTLNENVVKCYYSTIFLGAHSLDEENVRAVERSCEVLNAYLGEREYVAGDTLTIADFAIHTTICVLLAKIKMPIDFYQFLGSPPCRAVALTAAALGIEMNFKPVNLLNKEQLKPEFLKMNPQHTIPTIDDNGFYLWESRAIMMYLADQYGKNDSLYPKDVKKRAIVNQRLYFDMCNLYKSFMDYVIYPVVFMKMPKDPTKYESIDRALSFLDKFLEGENYVAGKNMTLADLSIVTTVSTIEVVDYDLGKYENVARWFAKVKSEIPKYEEYNDVGLKMFKDFVNEKLSRK
ncbi:glutathione S-transferase 1-1 isoform X3 [Apis cerana]|uniref:glutathione S-transferase 1-1 isoform X3 n=2 Tax=Apis cerana TaxID=7461 RepID=UPI002B2325AE|nr:glutathione S-transferase 1-1 isoform X3 [Apis cerana]